MSMDYINLLLLEAMYHRHMRRHYAYLVILGLACMALGLIALVHAGNNGNVIAVAGIQ